jgi:hypothetical protein
VVVHTPVRWARLTEALVSLLKLLVFDQVRFLVPVDQTVCQWLREPMVPPLPWPVLQATLPVLLQPLPLLKS